MEIFKAIPLGAILTWVVSIVIGKQGSSGGFLAIHTIEAWEYSLWWSWPLFFAATGVAWGLMIMQR